MRFIDRVRVQWRKGSRKEFWHHHLQHTLLFALGSDFGEEEEGKTGVSETLSLSLTCAYEWMLLNEKPGCGIFISSDGPKLKKRKHMKLAERNTKGTGPIRAEELGYFPVEGGETLKNLSRKTTLTVCLCNVYMIIHIFIFTYRNMWMFIYTGMCCA